jgi:glutamyl-tRNA reductase
VTSCEAPAANLDMTSCVSGAIVQVGVDHTNPRFQTFAAAAVSRNRDPYELFSREIGLVALVTCHRLELYLDAASPAAARSAFCAWLGGSPEVVSPVVRAGASAARHLFRVAAGLESAVLGEDQVLAQARAAYSGACDRSRAGAMLHRLFHAAFRTGRRVRSETGLGAGTRSLAGAAVAALHEHVGGLCGRSVLLIGAGTTGRLAARLIASRRVARLTIVNRTASRAAELAHALGGQWAPWPWRAGLLATVDAAVCAVRADAPVLEAADLRDAAAARRRPITIVDLGVPPNVQSAEVPGVTLIDLDAIARRLRGDADRRASAIAAAERVVSEELDAWVASSTPRCGPRAARSAAG